jgi:predicted transcriptional regulator
MKDVLVLRELEGIKAISHPYRIDILESFDKEPLSAKQLSEILKEPHAKINYHIKTLHKAGILDLVNQKIKSGIIEKYYLPTAKRIVIGKNILSFELEEDINKNQEYISLFEKISYDFYNAIENNVVDQNNINHFNNISLTQKEANEIMGAINEKVEEVIKNRYDFNGEYECKYDISMLVLPKD